MTEQAGGQEEARLRELRVYRDAGTGELLPIHRYAETRRRRLLQDGLSCGRA
jgi:hypothetical protein